MNDDISALGNVVINSGARCRSVIYQHCNGCNNYLSIDIDPNNKIRRIVYIERQTCIFLLYEHPVLKTDDIIFDKTVYVLKL